MEHFTQLKGRASQNHYESLYKYLNLVISLKMFLKCDYKDRYFLKRKRQLSHQLPPCYRHHGHQYSYQMSLTQDLLEQHSALPVGYLLLCFVRDCSPVDYGKKHVCQLSSVRLLL